MDKLHELARPYGINVTHLHSRSGNLVEVLGSLIEAMDVGLIVVGARSNSGQRKVPDNNTTASLMRALPIDLLVIRATPSVDINVKVASGHR